MLTTRGLLAGVALALFGAGARADVEPVPSFTKDVKPFLNRYCTECHNGKKAKAGIKLDSYEAMMEKSRKKPVLAGEPDDSLLLQTLEGDAKPMPPRKYARHPTEKEIKMVRTWIAAGAKKDE